MHGSDAQRGRVTAGSHPCPGGEELGTGVGTRKKGMEGIGGKGVCVCVVQRGSVGIKRKGEKGGRNGERREVGGGKEGGLAGEIGREGRKGGWRKGRRDEGREERGL